jgi:hypothetical protein
MEDYHINPNQRYIKSITNVPIKKKDILEGAWELEGTWEDNALQLEASKNG